MGVGVEAVHPPVMEPRNKIKKYRKAKRFIKNPKENLLEILRQVITLVIILQLDQNSINLFRPSSNWVLSNPQSAIVRMLILCNRLLIIIKKKYDFDQFQREFLKKQSENRHFKFNVVFVLKVVTFKPYCYICRNLRKPYFSNSH